MALYLIKLHGIFYFQRNLVSFYMSPILPDIFCSVAATTLILQVFVNKELLLRHITNYNFTV